MNRKLLVIAMVPLLVGFAGAMAFSSWDASVTKTIYVTTGTVELKEKVVCVGAYIEGTVSIGFAWQSSGPNGQSGEKTLTLDGGSDHSVSGCQRVTECTIWTSDGRCDPSLTDPSRLVLGEFTFLGPGVTGAQYIFAAIGLSPGDWIELMAIDTIVEPASTITASLTNTLTPSHLASTVTSGYTFTSAAPLGPPGFGPSDALNPSTGWTYLQDLPANPCAATYIAPSPALPDIDVGGQIASHPSIGLEYCNSGPSGFVPGNPYTASPALSPTSGPLTLSPSSPSTYQYLLFGEDASAVGLSNSGMGLGGALCYTVSAEAP